MTSKQQNNGPDKLVNLGLKAGDVVCFQGREADVVEDRDGELWVEDMALEYWQSPNWTVVSRDQNNGPDRLVNLGLKAGDVVRLMDHDPYTVEDRCGELWAFGSALKDWQSPNWTVVSRASDAKPDTYDLSNPDKLIFEEMPDAMKGAMLLAHHRGEVIQSFGSSGSWGYCDPCWFKGAVYRVKPKALKVSDDIVLYGVSTFFDEIQGSYDSRKITIPADENRLPIPGTYTCDGREIIVEAV